MILNFSDLPEKTRVKLTEEGCKDLWHRVDEFGGVQTLSEAFDFSASKMYNWKNKDSYMPKAFIKRLMGENPPSVKAVKGPGRGKEWKTDFPLEIDEELLTRIEASVAVNQKGIPFYLTDERSLAQRLSQLLEEIGVEHSFYSRDRYEIRYPKFVHRVLSGLEFKTDFSALVDEEGHIEEGVVKASGREMAVESFSGKLYSRRKSFELALARGDKEKIAELISEESSKVRKMVE